MRIAIIVDTFPSLSETFISNKVIQLSLRGHRVIVFCNKTNKQLLAQLGDDVQDVQIVLFTKKAVLLYAMLHPFMLLRSEVAVHGLKQRVLRMFRSHSINKARPEIIHFEFSGIGIEYLPEMELLRGRIVVSCRGTAEKVKLLLYADRQEKFRQLLDKVDKVHCVSEDMRKTILPYCSDPEKIFINFPSIHPGYFHRDDTCNKRSGNMILSVGRITFQKGHLHGLMAMKKLQQAGISFNWVIIGNGNKFEELVFKTRQLGLQNHVKLIGVGSKNEVRQFMQEATIFFLPSVYEGIANVVLEAMSMELPVVSTRCGGMEDVISHGENGLLADVYDYNDMAAQLARMISDESLRNRLAVNGRNTIEQHFNIKQQTDRFEEVYRQLAAKETDALKYAGNAA